MKITIYIKDKISRETVRFDETDYEWQDDDGIQFMFGDGNYACDCNRHLFFLAGKNGKWPRDIDRVECGSERFLVCVKENGTDRIIYEDDDWK